jgi:hypothetical protein
MSLVDWTLPTPEHYSAVTVCFDQQKANFAWLCFPDIETFGFKILPDAFVASISDNWDIETQEALKLRPLAFVNYWQEQKRSGRLTLEEELPEGYMNTLTKQAQKAHVRLLGLVQKGTVTSINFRTESFTRDSFDAAGRPCNITPKEAV